MPRYQYAPSAEFQRAKPDRKRSDLHVLILVIVWLSIASGAVVFSEPAPFDVLMMGLIVLLPIAALAVFTPGMLLLLASWLLIAGTGLGAAALSLDITKSTIHTVVTLYLSVAAVILAAFIHKRPEAHMRLVMNAYMWSAAVAAMLGIIGYFNLLPGTFDLFTSFGRARGAFKDPNVFGPYLVPPLVYAIHLWLTLPSSRTVMPLSLVGILSFALLLSFSRGAWLNLAIALGVFGYLSFILARNNWMRFKLTVGAIGCVVALAAVGLVALQFDSIAKLAEQRFSLDQTYDQGPEGRFGGQLKALRLIVDNPLGIGAGEFTQRHHHEEVHNVYLSMLLNNGWAGGILYALTVLITLLFGLRQVFRRSAVQSYLIIAWSCLLAVAIEGILIDTDHWRHFFVLTGLVWGLAETARVPQVVQSPVSIRRLRRVLVQQIRPVAPLPIAAAVRPRTPVRFMPVHGVRWPHAVRIDQVGRLMPMPRGAIRLN